MRKSVLAAVTAMTVPLPAIAAQAVDQSYVEAAAGAGPTLAKTSSSTDPTFRRAQTFTAGVTDTLTRIDVRLAFGTLTGVNLLSTSGGTPSTIVTTGTYAGMTSDGWTSFTLGFAQIAGTVYAF